MWRFQRPSASAPSSSLFGSTTTIVWFLLVLSPLLLSSSPGVTVSAQEAAAAAVDTCNDSEHQCYHGGTCVQAATDNGSTVELACDCSTAVDATTGQLYIGKYCQLETVSVQAETCTEENQDVFCFNGGVCNQQFP